MVLHQPWRRPFAMASAALLAVACLLIGYRLGVDGQIADNASNSTLQERFATAQKQVSRLQSKLIDAELVNDVQKQAASQLRTELKDLHGQVDRLREEVTFYKSLMAPGEVQDGLQINALEVVRLPGEHAYAFELLLTQVAVRRSFISGEVRVDLIGHDGTGQVVKSLTDLAIDQVYPLKFKFRYFQDITGTFALTEDFVPERMLVTAEERGKEPLQVSFPWPLAAGDHAPDGAETATR